MIGERAGTEKDVLTAHASNTRGSLRLFTLGGFWAEQSGTRIEESAWQRPTARTLVKLLAVDPVHRLHREQILDTLWPDLSATSAATAFRNALHRARHALEPDLPPKSASSYLLFADDTVSLAPSVWVDTDQFERLATQALAEPGVAALEAALAVYTGDLLPEDLYADWCQERREAFSRIVMNLLSMLASMLEEEGNLAGAERRLQEVLIRDSTREDVHRRLMRLFTVQGRRHDALRQYQLCRDALSELGAQPEPETDAMYEEVLAGHVTSAVQPRPDSPSDSSFIPLPGVLNRIPATGFIGRDRALLLLLADLERSAQGNGGMVLLGGEAGVGKSRLATEVAREAQRRGFLVLWGASYDQEGLLPYGPFVEAIRDYLRHRPVAEQQGIAVKYPELARLLALHDETFPSPDTSSYRIEVERGRLHASTARFLADLARLHPVLLVLDDVHLADAASLALLHHLARTAAENRWLVLGTYREEDVVAAGEFQRLSTTLIGHTLCHRTYLFRLARHECDALVQELFPGGVPTPSLLDHLYELSLGNPLFVQELVGAMRGRGQVTLQGGVWQATDLDTLTVPRHVQDLVQARVRSMPDQVGHVLGLAAVSGMEFSFAELRRAAPVALNLQPSGSDAVLLDALDTALHAGLLEERQDSYAFVHPLFRETLYKGLTGPRRQHWHAAVGAAIEVMAPQRVEQLAYHYDRSADLGKAMLYLERAGDRAAAIFAHQAAESHFRALLRHAERANRDPERARALEKLSSVLQFVRRPDESMQAAEHALTLYQTVEDLQGLARTAVQIGRLHRDQATFDEGITRIQRVLDMYPTVASSERAALYVGLGHLWFSSGHHQEAADAAAQGEKLARTVQDKRVLAEALMRRGTALGWLNAKDQGLQLLDESMSLAEETNALDTLGVALNNAGDVCSEHGEFGRAVAYLERAAQVGEKVGVSYGIFTLSTLLIYVGSWEDADRCIERCQNGAVGHAWYRPFVYLDRGHLQFRRGQVADAIESLDRGLELAIDLSVAQVVRNIHLLRAEIDIVRGHPEAAAAWLCEDGPLHNSQSQALHAWALLESNEDIDRAEQVAESAVIASLDSHNQRSRIQALRVRGLILARRNRWDEAIRDLQEVVESTTHMPYPYEQARTLRDLGTIYGKQGHHHRANACIREATAIFRRLGAERDVALSQTLWPR